MYTYLFSGKIHPERVNFNLTIPGSLTIRDLFFEVDEEITMCFDNSLVTVKMISKVDYSKNIKCNYETLGSLIEESIRLIVDAYCYINSFCWDVEIVKMVCEDLDIDYFFQARGEWNMPKKDDVQVEKEMTRLINLSLGSKRSFLRHVFGDFRRAAKYSVMTPGFCFRAIETIRKCYFEDKSILVDQEREKVGWEKMGQILGFQKSDSQEIKKLAFDNRHGVYPPMTYLQRERIMNFTRNVIDKFIEHLSLVG